MDITREGRFARLWERTDRIFGLLAPQAWLAQPIALRHPFVFYLGHLPAFAWNHVCASGLGRPAFNAAFDELFSRGIDPDVDDPEHCHDHPEIPDRWPSLPQVLAYRDRVRGAVLEACGSVTEGGPAREAPRAAEDPEARMDRILSMVIEHELMHQETLLYMLQRLPREDKIRPDWLPAPVLGATRRASEPPARASIAPGMASLGARADAVPFGWDNEFPGIERFVPGFHIDVTPVTNARFLSFVDDGGYRRPELWNADDWAWRAQADLDHPIVWERHGAGWRYRALFDMLPLEAVGDWPVYASLAEARAFARWQGGRLPSEAEYQRAAYADPDGGDRRFPWGVAAPTARHGNFDFHHWTPTPVGSHPEGASAWAVHDLIGDGWEWTDTAFAGFPGFTPLGTYPGYSADFFDGKHAVLKGGSWATEAGLVRPSFRNWFQAHYPYVFAKFRCASS